MYLRWSQERRSVGGTLGVSIKVSWPGEHTYLEFVHVFLGQDWTDFCFRISVPASLLQEFNIIFPFVTINLGMLIQLHPNGIVFCFLEESKGHKKILIKGFISSGEYLIEQFVLFDTDSTTRHSF